MDKATSIKFRQISFFAILCVVSVHCYTLGRSMAGNSITFEQSPITYYVQDFISQGLVRIGLPFFFIISGYFLFLSMRRFDSMKTYYSYAITKRLRSVVLPYLLWSILWILVYILLHMIPIIHENLSRDSFLVVPFARKMELIFLDPIPFQFWYLRRLMVFVILLPVFYYSIKYLGLLVPIGVFLVWLKTWNIGVVGIQDIFFFTLGCYLAIHNKLLPNFKKSTSFVLLFIWISGLVVVTYFVLQYPDSLVFQGFKKTLRIVGVVTVWSLFSYIPDKFGNLLLKGTTYTFFIYAIHEPMLSLFLGVTSRFLPFSESYHLILYFSNFVLAPPLSLLLGILANRYMNPVFRTLSGGR